MGVCRSKLGAFEKTDFELHACAWCYLYLFPGHAFMPHMTILTDFKLVSKDNVSQSVIPDIHNQTSVNKICSELTNDECERWRFCCQSANDCCTQQLSARVDDVMVNCPATWDGYGCWTRGTPGVISQIACPTFLQYSVPTSMLLHLINKMLLFLTKLNKHALKRKQWHLTIHLYVFNEFIQYYNIHVL